MGSEGFGIIARDSRGRFLGGGSIKSEGQFALIMMEACAMMEGMKMASEMGWSSVIMEIDCQRLVKDLRNNARIDSELGTIYQNIRNLSKRFVSCSFSFVRRNENEITTSLQGGSNGILKVWSGC